MKEGWEYKKLGEICEYSIGLTYKPQDVCDNGTIVLRSSNIQNELLDLNDVVRVNCPIKESLFVHKGDILMCSRNGSSRLVGKVAMIPETYERMTYGTFMMIIRSDYNPFLLYFFKSNVFRNQIKRGEANMINQITRYMLDDVVVCFPPLSEQQSIVEYLDSAFAKIDAMKANAEKALNEAKALFQASLKDMLEPKEGWEEKKMSSIYDVRDGTHDSPKYQESGYPLVTSKNLRGGVLDMTKVNYISESDYVSINNRSKVDVGDVLFAMIGTIGNPVYVEEEPYYAIKNMALFKVPEAQSGKFLSYYLQKDDVIIKMQKESKGTTQKFVSLGYLRNFGMTIPPLSEQQSIVETLDSLKSKVDKLQENYDKISQECDALKQAILRQVFE